VNTIGMRRAGLPSSEIQAVRRAFAILYKERLTISAALLQIEAQLGSSAAAAEVVAFIRASKRGICGAHRLHMHGEDAAA
jgi:UDP-N-acetylglucosamine acyltransferase